LVQRGGGGKGETEGRKGDNVEKRGVSGAQGGRGELIEREGKKTGGKSGQKSTCALCRAILNPWRKKGSRG